MALNNLSDYFVNAPVNLAAGEHFSTQVGSDGAVTHYTVITDVGVANDTSSTSLQGINNNLAGNYVLGSDIDASDTANWTSTTGTGFEPIGTRNNSFTGQLHGLGHPLSALSINSSRTSDDVGLFGDVGHSGVLRDVSLLAANVISSREGDHATGALAGQNDGVISNAYSDSASNVSGANKVGGLVGDNSGRISNLSNYNATSVTGNISGVDDVGGLVGYNSGSVDNIYLNSTNNVTGVNHVGGLVGYNTGNISNATIYNYHDNYTIYGEATNTSTESDTGTVTDTNADADTDTGTVTDTNADVETSTVPENVGAGAVIDIHNTLVSDNRGGRGDAYANPTGIISGVNNVGGLVGYNSGNIDNASTTVAVTGTNVVGGLVGYNAGNIGSASSDNTYNYIASAGSVTGVNTVGGLVGYNNGNINNAVATGSVTATGNYVGGLVGENNGNISNNSNATSDVTGIDYVGGLVGANSGNIDKAYSAGSVTGTGNYIGGLVGENSNSVSNTYSTSSVVGVDSVGGLVGHNRANSTLNDSYSTGKISGNSHVGGLVGANDGVVNRSFWDTDSSAQTSSAGGVGKTSAEMQQLATFEGWSISDNYDGDSVWQLYEANGTPFLRGLNNIRWVSKTPDVITMQPMIGEPLFNIADATIDSPRINDISVKGNTQLVSTHPLGLESQLSPLQTLSNNQGRQQGNHQTLESINTQHQARIDNEFVSIEQGGLKLPSK